MKNKKRIKTKYIIFACDTETQTYFNDDIYYQYYQNFDYAFKKLEIACDKETDPIKFKQLNEKRKEYSKRVEFAKKTLCTDVVTYMSGYVYTGHTTTGANGKLIKNNQLIKIDDGVIKKRRKVSKQKHNNESCLNQINYFLADNNTESSIIKMFDDIVRKYGHLINKENGKYTALLYYHNLKFDIRAILYQQFIENKKDFITAENNDILLSNGQIYKYTFIYKGCRFELRDSYKLLPESIKELGKLVDVPKLDDENTYKYHDLHNTSELLKELKYFKHDILILKKSLDFLFNDTKNLELTISSIAYNTGKRVLLNQKKKPLRSIFIEEYYKSMKHNKAITPTEQEYFKNKFWNDYRFYSNSYAGGFVLVNQNIIGKVLENGITFDVNSLYPSVMLNRDYPNIFKQKAIKTQEELNNLLWDIENVKHDWCFGVVTIQLRKLELKENAIPCVPKKFGTGTGDSNADMETRKPIKSINQIVNRSKIITVTVLDLYHIIKNYDVKYQLINGYKFTRDVKNAMMLKPFKNYILPLKNEKEKLEKDDPNRLLVKLKMNSFYGKFGQKPKETNIITKDIAEDEYKNIAYFSENNENTINYSEASENSMKNMLLASAITAYARDVLLSTMESVNASGKAFVAYCDTDSIHVYPTKNNSFNIDYSKSLDELYSECKKIAHELGIEYDEHKLGAWKAEQFMTKAVYLANKKYWEVDPVNNPKNPDIIKCAGISPEGREYLRSKGFKNFAKIDVDGILVPTKTAISLRSGIRIEKVWKKLRCEDNKQEVL